MGIIGAQTPFVTGTPFTLLNSNRELQPGGVVGLALKIGSPFKLIQKQFGLKRIGKSFKISRCRGNVVLEINDSTATKELLDLLNAKRSDNVQAAESHDIFASVSPPKNTQVLYENDMIFKVIGGDPSKGTLALDTDFELQPGMALQFMAPRSETEIQENISMDSSHNSDSKAVVEFMCSMDGRPGPMLTQHVSSSSGILIGLGNECKTYLCQAPYFSVSLSLS
jgi:small ligand-binding sensory domain FIST